MAFTETAVYIGAVAALVLLVAGIITLLATRKSPGNKKWGWILLGLSTCALVSAITNASGVFY